MTLVGAMYAAPPNAKPADLDARLPPSFAHWHEHVDFCGPYARFRARRRAKSRRARAPRVGSQINTRKDCTAAGGRFVPRIFGWMAHVYLFAGDDLKVIWGEEHTSMDVHMHHPPDMMTARPPRFPRLAFVFTLEASVPNRIHPGERYEHIRRRIVACRRSLIGASAVAAQLADRTAAAVGVWIRRAASFHSGRDARPTGHAAVAAARHPTRRRAPFRAARRRSRSRRFATASDPPTGFPATIRRCRDRRAWPPRRDDHRLFALPLSERQRPRRRTPALSGLPSQYFVQTMMDFKNGARKSADRERRTPSHDHVRQGDDRRRDQSRGGVLRVDEVDAVGPGRREPTPCRRRASPAECSSSSKARTPARSRSASASSKCRRTPRKPRRCAIRVRDSSRMCPRQHQEGRSAGDTRAVRALSRSESRGTRPGARASPGARRATSCASSTTCSTARATGMWSELMKPVVAPMTPDDMLNSRRTPRRARLD